MVSRCWVTSSWMEPGNYHEWKNIVWWLCNDNDMNDCGGSVCTQMPCMQLGSQGSRSYTRAMPLHASQTRRFLGQSPVRVGVTTAPRAGEYKHWTRPYRIEMVNITFNNFRQPSASSCSFLAILPDTHCWWPHPTSLFYSEHPIAVRRAEWARLQRHLGTRAATGQIPLSPSQLRYSHQSSWQSRTGEDQYTCCKHARVDAAYKNTDYH